MHLSSSCQLEILYEYDLLKQGSIWFAASSHECIEISQQHSKITTRTCCFSCLKARFSHSKKQICLHQAAFWYLHIQWVPGYVPGLSLCCNLPCKKASLGDHKSLQLSVLEVESKLQTSFGQNFRILIPFSSLKKKNIYI